MMKMEVRELGFMSTQYERFGNISKEDVINALIDEEVRDSVNIEMLSVYNMFLSENEDETYFNMDEFDNMLSGYSPLEIANMIHYGNFDGTHRFFKFNGYGNIESFSESEIVKEMKADLDFLQWFVEENELITEKEINQAIEWGGKFLAMGY